MRSIPSAGNLQTSSRMRAFAAPFALLGVITACVAAPLRQPPAGTPHCVTNGGDTVAANVFFEFQVATPARPLPPTVPGTAGSRTLAVTFVVDTAGMPEPASIHAVTRAESSFVAAARPAVATRRYEPARLAGCRVQQVVQELVWLP